ncbi:MAG: Sensor histidine kinase TodS [Firmicutes bacterium ADurb.Bin419]|nr:MAG: Sensor histidine kinase TodS [Firmicutes bacterium ADurb.Bin419]
MKILNCFLYKLKKDSKNGYFQKRFYTFIDGKPNTCGNYNAEDEFEDFEESDGELELDIEKMFEGDRHTYLFHILHVRNELVGCAFYEYGVWDDRIYSSLSVQLSAAIKSAEVLKKLEKSNIELSKLDKLKNDFIANITHDFRSPLMIILNNTDIALKYDNISESANKRYSVIYESALMLRAAIDRLLDLVKMDAQGLKVHAKKTRISNFVDSISDFYKSALLSSNINIVKRIHIIDDHIYTDLVVLEEVLNNIISNAIKFVDPLKGEIYIELEETNNSIRIIIGDNGIGIPKDKLETIFGRFGQIESGMNSKYKGTGIGLAFSRQLIQYLKGRIWAESKGLGHGSRFIIELPKGEDIFSPDEIDNNTSFETGTSEFKNLLQIELKNKFEDNDMEVHFEELNKENEFNYKKAVILVVDDNKQIREIVCEYLNNNGYLNWITAADGLQGIEAAYRYRPDLILCDYNMPNMKGDQFHDELISNPDFKKTPFIFLSALTDRKLILDRKRKGAIDYLNKPVNEAELILSLDIHLQQYMELKSTLYMATIDELTGINNKRNLNKLLSAQFSIRSLRDISVIFFDLDFFKLINDTYGHSAGDIVLKEIGKVLRSTLRTYDIYGRFGGEEFLIALPETSEDNAILVAEKLRKRIETLEIIHNGIVIKITSSFGIVSLMKNKHYISQKLDIPDLKNIFEVDPKEVNNWNAVEDNKFRISNLLVSMADIALYEAKSTKCNTCGFSSVKKSDFPDNKCSKCDSDDISIGRNKCVVFNDLHHCS